MTRLLQGLPSGTVTLLFTDIEGSTRLLHEHGERYAEMLADHRRILRDAFAEQHGCEVDTQGDAFFVAFARATDAVWAAVAGQQRLADHAWPRRGELRVRMGLHTGEPTLTDEGYVGVDLHRGARICSAGHGGQVLVSEATRRLIADHDLAGLELRDLGPHRLKDLTEPQRLYQVVGEGLVQAFPPLRTLESRPSNLPVQATGLLGRSAELSEIGGWLAGGTPRLVTLTGPGGTGKTRLAVQAAANALDAFADGVFLVTLAAVTDPALVVPAITQALGLREGPGRTADVVLGEFLADRRMLLLLDNLEQVVLAAPHIADLLAIAPQLSILATSREPLHVAGEQEYPVQPLPVPAPAGLTGPNRAAQLADNDSVALFVERARAVRPSFHLDDDNADAVAAICVRLDGLPLAIELAAARSKVLPPQALLDRLDRRLTVLTGGARGAPARQQTLRGTIDWSFDLLADAERRLFARLAVFIDGCTLDAAEAVCDADGALGTAVLDGLASLVDKSLVREVEQPGSLPRFSMLETIREYAAERLAADPGLDEVRDVHADFFSDLAGQAVEALRAMGEQAWVERLEEEHGNLRSALAWLLTRRRTEPALTLIVGAWRAWLRVGRLREARTLMESVLDQASSSTSRQAVFARVVIGEIYRQQGEFELARQVKEDALPTLRETSPKLAAFTLADLGQVVEDLGRYDEARALIDESLALQRQIGDEDGIAHASCALGRLAIRTGDLDAALSSYANALEIGRRVDDYEYIDEALLGLAEVARREARTAEAEELYSEALTLAEEMRDLSFQVDALAGLAATAASRGEWVRAGRLLGAVAAVCAMSGQVLYFPDQREGLMGELADQLGPAAFDSAHGEGAQMSVAEATRYALTN